MPRLLQALQEAERYRLLRIEAERRGLAVASSNPLARFQFAPAAYIRERLGWEPWEGDGEHPGQVEVIDAYTLALRQLHERDAWEHGLITDGSLRYWRPGQVIQNRIRLEAGHTVGKTKLLSGLVNHFYDCFTPSIIYTFAPSWEQIHDLLWKEIKTDRRDKGLPGRILDLELKQADNHFAKGRATDNSGGTGTTRIQGQHGRYLCFVLDEAEGVANFVYNAVRSMTSGGIAIVLMAANPQSRSSTFHKQKDLSTVRSFRLSCIHHPNVVAGREVVPGAVRRQFVEEMIEEHCEVVPDHDPDEHTFELAFDAQVGETVYPAGTVFKPDAEFMFRVLGIAPKNIADKTLIPTGRFEAACDRLAPYEDPEDAWLGVDVARFGKDRGTLYARHRGRAWREKQFAEQDTEEYYQAIRALALELHAAGARRLRIRIDGGGGFGGGVVDRLIRDTELARKFPLYHVVEVNFNGVPYEQAAYYDLITELHAAAAQVLKLIRVVAPPTTLEGDLCEREFRWVIKAGRSVRKLESKDEVRKPERLGRSPDDGDGFVLCVAPDHLFASVPTFHEVTEDTAGGTGRGINRYRDAG